MRISIDFTRRTAHPEISEHDSVSILCTDRVDGLKYFADHYPGARIVNVEDTPILDPKFSVKIYSNQSALA